jgi:hypothetical protein
MRTLCLNSKNIVEGSNNSQLQYNFPSGSIELKEGDQLALSSVSMYNSVFNITSTLQNNSYTYKWIDGSSNTVTMPNGYYDVDSLNDFLHQTMLQNKHYLVEVATGNFVWFLTLQVNVSVYKIEITCYPMANATYKTSAYSLPVGATWAIQDATITPYIFIPATNIQSTLGFPTGFYFSGTGGASLTEPLITGTSPDKVQNSAKTAITVLQSPNVPQITSLTSYLITCSLINNNYSIPNTLLSAFPPSSAFAEQFVFSPNQMSFIDCQPGSYGSFVVTLLDQNLRQIAIQDSQIVVLLVIRSKNELA